MSAIANVTSRKILDSRSSYTIEVTLTADSGAMGKTAVPAGVSAGSFEAKAVSAEQAVENINKKILPAIEGMRVDDQSALDAKLIELDGSSDKSNLGANAILGISLAAASASAQEQQLPLFRYLAGLANNQSPSLPRPLFNVVEGGLHAPGGADFQEFLITPASYWSFTQSLEASTKIYKTIRELLLEGGKAPLLGDEGGYGSVGILINAVFDLLTEACRRSGFTAGKDIYFGSDVAANSFYQNNLYRLQNGEDSQSSSNMSLLYLNLLEKYPIIYLEDPFFEEAWEDWTNLTKQVGDKSLVVGDDLTVTNPQRLQEAITRKAITGIIIKPNQIGTLSETLAVVDQARQAGLQIIVSHRGGETTDSFIADLAVGISADFIKAGGPARGERVAKYNRLLAIENKLKPAGKTD